MKFFILISILIIPSLSYAETTEVKSLDKIEKSILNIEKTAIETREQNLQNSKKIDVIYAKSNESNFVSNFIISIINSFLAALIFWLIFNKYTDYRNKKRIRPKIDIDLHHIYVDLFFVFDTVMQDKNMYSPSIFQQEIKAGELSKEDIELGLQNKSINETCLYGACSNNLIIGKRLYEAFTKIDQNIDRIFQFNQYLDIENEVPLLENIHQCINQYSLKNYADSVHTNIGGKFFGPVTPNLNYLKNNLYDLYQLYLQLQVIIFKIEELMSEDKNRNLLLSKLEYFYKKKNYKKLKATIKLAQIKFTSPTDKLLLSTYIFLLAYSQNHGKGYKVLSEVSKANGFDQYLGFLAPVFDDVDVEKILLNNSISKEKFLEIRNRSFNKDIERELFFKNARKIKYSEKHIE